MSGRMTDRSPSGEAAGPDTRGARVAIESGTGHWGLRVHFMSPSIPAANHGREHCERRQGRINIS